MESNKIAVKFFLAEGATLDPSAVVPVFHSWIQSHALADHLLVDVADYAHVRGGPGAVLVAHEANVSTDLADGRPGLLYARKQPITGAQTFAARLRAVFRWALEACRRLEEARFERGPLRFRTDNPLLRVNDRLLAPNEPATFEAVRAELQAFADELYGGSALLEYVGESDRPFEVRLTAPASAASPPATELLRRLGA